MGERFPEEWDRWLKSLSREELAEEIQREEQAQTARRQTLTEIESSIAETLQTIQNEKLPDRTKRAEERRKRIQELRRVIAEWSRQIERVRAVIRDYNRRISEVEAQLEPLEELRAYYEAQLRFLPTFYYLQRDRFRRLLESVRREITALRRRIAGYRGYITTQRSLLYGREGVYEGMIQIRASAIGELGAHERQLRIEEPLLQRLEALYEQVGYLKEQGEALSREIEQEEKRLEYKKSLVPPIVKQTVQRKVALFAIIVGEKRPYTKRFECVYSIDTIRDTQTGEFLIEDPLTRRELEECWIDFFMRFRWVELPIETVESGEAWSSEFWLTEGAEGAYLYLISVRADGEEIYRDPEEGEYEPPVLIYKPTEEENMEFLRRAKE